MFAPYLEKTKPTFLLWFIRGSSVHLTATQILTDFNNFCTAETGKDVQNRACISYLLLKVSVANDVINVSLSAGPVRCEPHHQ